MPSRRATDAEVAQWDKDGWALLTGLVAADEIDRALEDVFRVFPRPERFHADPARYISPGRTNADLRRGHPPYPEHGPAWRPEQHRWAHEFPFHGSGALNRLVVHDAVVDFAERALGTPDIRCYQAALNARYEGDADYEQPMHTDRNHSLLAPTAHPPWWHVESFLYLSDVDDDVMPTHLVRKQEAAAHSVNDVLWPDRNPEIYDAEAAATGPRGSLLVYRSDVFHRAVNMERPGGARFLLNVSYKRADIDWIGYHSIEPRTTHPAWAQFVGEATPRQLELFGWPPPGHPVWTDALLSATKEKYPALDDGPWRNALRR